MHDLPGAYPEQCVPTEERGILPANFLVKRYEDVSGKKFNGWWLHSGLLEIGRVLGENAALKILEGCLSPIRVSHLWEDFHTAFREMEEEQLKSRKPISIVDVTEAGTMAIALSYKQQHDVKTEQYPRRRMNSEQKAHLLEALREVIWRRNPERIVLWVDQAMTQRNPFCAQNWVQNGILPYFAFDVISLKFKNDQERLWLYLENLIARTDAKVREITDDAMLFEKSFGQSTIDSIRSVAAKCTNTTLQRKHAFDDNDKHLVRDWAATLLNQRTLRHKVPNAELAKVQRHYPCAMKPWVYAIPFASLTAVSKNCSTPIDRVCQAPDHTRILYSNALVSCSAHTEPAGYAPGPSNSSAVCMPIPEPIAGGYPAAGLIACEPPPAVLPTESLESVNVSGSNSIPATEICTDIREALGDIFATYSVPMNSVRWRLKDIHRPIYLHRWHGLLELVGQKYQELSWRECQKFDEHLRRLGSSYIFKLFSGNNPSPVNIAIGRYSWRGQSACSRILLCMLSGTENNRNTYVRATCVLDADYVVDTNASAFLRRFDRLSSEYLRTIENKQDCLNKLFEWTWFAQALNSVGIFGFSNYHGSIRAVDVWFISYYDR